MTSPRFVEGSENGSAATARTPTLKVSGLSVPPENNNNFENNDLSSLPEENLYPIDSIDVRKTANKENNISSSLPEENLYPIDIIRYLKNYHWEIQ